jgi:CHAT domain-containing protein
MFAPLEAAMVQAAAGNQWAIDVVQPADASPETAQHAASKAETLHVIAHGSFEDRSPYRSGMQLGQPNGASRFWIVADVFTEVVAPAGRLVVLSGCDTGQVRPNIVSEEVSLPAAFLAAGYAAVVASRWAVNDRSTSLLMAELYRRWLAGGISIAKALDGATKWLRELDRETAADMVSKLPRAGDSVGGAEDWDGYLPEAEDLRAGAARPFESPSHWAAFFVAGDGAITADGVDSRIPVTMPEAEAN